MDTGCGKTVWMALILKLRCDVVGCREIDLVGPGTFEQTHEILLKEFFAASFMLSSDINGARQFTQVMNNGVFDLFTC